MYLLLDFPMSKKERVICEFDIDFKKSFCCRSNLSNADNNIIIVFSANARSNNQGGK